MPERIQRKRTKGWRMPAGAVYVGRPTKWGNPFKGEDGASTGAREILVEQFRMWLTLPGDGPCPHFLHVPFAGRPTLDEIRQALAGKDLACWCPIGQPCHADVLLELANKTPAEIELPLTDLDEQEEAEALAYVMAHKPTIDELRRLNRDTLWSWPLVVLMGILDCGVSLDGNGGASVAVRPVERDGRVDVVFVLRGAKRREAVD